MIEKLRKEIDGIDDSIIQSLAKRKNLIKEIATIKKKQNKPIIDEEREQQITERLKKIATENDLDENFVISIYKIILKNSREEQKTARKWK